MPMKPATKMLFALKLCGAFSRMLLLCILSNLKLFLRYKFLVLDACHPDALFLCEHLWFLSKPKRFCKKKKLLGTLL